MVSLYLKNILSGDVISVNFAQPLESALQIMSEKKISCILVMDKNRPKGILTERDVVKIADHSKEYKNLKVGEIMSRPLLTVSEGMDILEAYATLRSEKIRHLVTVDSKGKVTGIITFTDIVNQLTKIICDDRLVSEIMTKKVITLKPDATLSKAIKEMSEKSISCIVIEKNSRPVGLITERDISGIMLSVPDLKAEKASQWMNSPVNIVKHDTPLSDAIRMLGIKGCRRFVVVDEDDKMIGLITQSDIIKGYLGASYTSRLHENVKIKEEALKVCCDRFNATSRQMPDSLILAEVSQADNSPVIIDVNCTYSKMYGYGRNEVIGRTLDTLLGGELSKTPPWDMQKLAEGDILHFEAVHVRKDHSRFPVEISASVVDTGGEMLLVTLVRDISERKEAEKIIIDAKEKAENATKLKDKFVSLVAHDLRGPLATIGGMASAIQDNKENQHNEIDVKLLNAIMRTVNNTIETIDDLLDLSKIQSGVMTVSKEFMNATSLVANTIMELSFIAERKGITLLNEVDTMQRIYGDRSLIAHVLQNLLSNSIKFCNSGDSVTFKSVTGTMTGISVEDTGIGVEAFLLPDLFKPEKKTSCIGTSGELGTGLGLPLSMEIMLAHDGDITVDAKREKGSLFAISLPPVLPNILIADDDKNYRELVMVQLEGLLFNFVEAVNGEDALNKIKNDNMHLLILDLKMPVMDGFEVLSQLKGNPHTASLPVIVSTIDSVVEAKNKAFRLGASDFISKDATPNELIPRVRRFVG